MSFNPLIRALTALLLPLLLSACGSIQIVIEYPTSPTAPPASPQAHTATLTPTPVTDVFQPTAMAPAKTPGANFYFKPGSPILLSRVKMLSPGLGWGLGRSGAETQDHVLITFDGGLSWRDVTPPAAFDPRSSPDLVAGAFFADANRAWVIFAPRNGAPVPESAVVWSTKDAGVSWISSPPLDFSGMEMVTFLPDGLGFSDALNGWLLVHLNYGAVNDEVALYTTRDGGASWVRVVDPAGHYLAGGCAKTGIVFRDALEGWITGDCGGLTPGVYFFKTSDGGRTWRPQALPSPADYPDLFKSSLSACGAATPHFISSGGYGYLTVRCIPEGNSRPLSWLYTTSDGGGDWTPHGLPIIFPYGSTFFLSPTVGWYLGAVSLDPSAEVRLYQTIDGGQTWTSLTGLGWTGVMDFADTQDGWVTAHAGGAQALVRTDNGGATWREIKPVAAP
jgi:photosystem II stability/assembly factor-like uncharacterized protein